LLDQKILIEIAAPTLFLLEEQRKAFSKIRETTSSSSHPNLYYGL
jgi:hypothetical protein